MTIRASIDAWLLRVHFGDAALAPDEERVVVIPG